MHRRRFVASLAASSVVATAGCIGGLLDDLTTFEASPVTVSDAAADEAGYEHERTEEDVRTREFSGEEVEVTNYVSEYRRTIDVTGLGDVDAGVFAAIASPQVSVAGKNFNPVGDWSRREIVDYVQSQYEELSVDGSAGVRNVNSLGQTVELETFEGTATIGSTTDVDVLVDVAKPDHGGDHLVLVGIYPADVPQEEERVTTLVEGLEHEE